MFPQCSHSSFNKSLLFDFFSSSSLYLIIINNNVELVFVKMYSYILITKKKIAVSSTIFFLLEEEDLHFRSHLSGTLLTVEPICLHQGIATLFSSRIFQKSCGRRIRTSDLKVMSLASYLCYHPTML